MYSACSLDDTLAYRKPRTPLLIDAHAVRRIVDTGFVFQLINPLNNVRTPQHPLKSSNFPFPPPDDFGEVRRVGAAGRYAPTNQDCDPLRRAPLPLCLLLRSIKKLSFEG